MSQRFDAEVRTLNAPAMYKISVFQCRAEEHTVPS